jgi:hypothetical protein
MLFNKTTPRVRPALRSGRPRRVAALQAHSLRPAWSSHPSTSPTVPSCYVTSWIPSEYLATIGSAIRKPNGPPRACPTRRRSRSHGSLCRGGKLATMPASSTRTDSFVSPVASMIGRNSWHQAAPADFDGRLPNGGSANGKRVGRRNWLGNLPRHAWRIDEVPSCGEVVTGTRRAMGVPAVTIVTSSPRRTSSRRPER